MRRSIFLALLAPTAALLLLHFFLQTRRPPQGTALPLAPSALLHGEEAHRVHAACRGRVVLDPYRLDPHPVARVGFEVSSAQETRFCQLAPGPDGALSAFRCAPLGAELQGMSLVGGSKGEAFLLAGLDRIATLDGGILAATAPGRASVDRVHVTSTGATVKLRDPLGGQPPGAVWSKGSLRFEVDAPSSAFLVAGHLLREADGGLLARPLLDEAPGFGPEVSVGPGAGLAQGRLRACRHGEGWEVVLSEPVEAPDRTAVLFRAYSARPGGWSGPREGRGEGVSGESWTLACSPGEVRVAWAVPRVEGGTDASALRVLRCGAQACQEQQATVRGLGLPRAGAWVEPPWLLSLGDEVALLWSRGASTEARIAPLDRLPDAPSRVLAAEPVDLATSEAIVREDAALVLLRPRGQAPHVLPFRLGKGGARALGCEPPGG